MASDFYATLGLNATASPEAIKRAYRAKVREAHPDTGGDPEAFRKVQEAYETLGDEEKRFFYDQRASINFIPSSDPNVFTPNPYFEPSSTEPTYDFSKTDFSQEGVDEMSKRLYEEVLRRQREAARVKEELGMLAQPSFPLKGLKTGRTLANLYVSASMWGLGLAQIKKWKEGDIWFIRTYLLLVAIIDLLTLVINGLHVGQDIPGDAGSIIAWFAGTMFLDVGLLALGVAVVVGLWAYRWVQYSILRPESRRPR